MHGRSSVLDVNSSSVFEVDALASDILDIFDTLDTASILSKLIKKYPAEDIWQAIGEIESFAIHGLFAKREASGTDPADLFSPSKQVSIRLNANLNCNLRCKYCYAHKAEGYENRARIMHESRARQAVDFAVDTFGREAENVAIRFGLTGEPLLGLELFDRIREHANKRGRETGKRITCYLTSTNGTLLSDEAIDYLEELGWESRNWPSLSIDGPQEIHDAMRVFPDGKGSYDKIEPLAKNYLSRCPVGDMAILTGDKPYVTEIFLHLFDMGFRYITIKPVRTSPGEGFALNESNIQRVKDEYTRFVNFLLRQDTSDLLCYLSALSDRDFFGRFFRRVLLHDKLVYRCPAAKWDISIDTNGDIYPCDSFDGVEDVKLGSIFTGIDESKRKQFIELHVDRKPVCSSCWARYLCGGGCYYAAWQANRRIEIPDRVKCQLIKHLIELGIFLSAEIEDRYPRIPKALASGFQLRTRPSPTPVTRCVFTPSPIPLDGDISKWKNAIPLHLHREPQFRGPKIWGGTEDISGSIYTLGGKEFFYFMAVVKDDIFYPPESTSRLSDGDSVQFSVTVSESAREHALSYQVHEYGLALIGNCPYVVRIAGPRDKNPGPMEDGDVFIRRIEDQTIYQTRIPWKELLPSCSGIPRAYGFNVIINEKDDPRQCRTWMEWTPGMVVEQDPSLFGKLALCGSS